MALDPEEISATLEAYAACEEIDALVARHSRVLRRYGGAGFVGAHIDRDDHARFLLLSDRPEVFAPLDGAGDWWAHDPVLARLAAGAAAPFRHEEAWAEPPPEGRMTRERLCDHGFRKGVVLPAAHPDALSAIDAFAETGRDGASCFAAKQAEVHLFSALFLGFTAALAPPGRAVGAFSVVRDSRAPGDGPVRLTPRERDCLIGCARGLESAAIADWLGLSPATVRGYIQDAMAKLGAGTRAQAVAIALRDRHICL